MFSIDNESFTRRRRLALAIMLAAAPVVVWGSFQTMARLQNNAVDWASSDHQARQRFEWFQQHFSPREQLVVSWSGCSLDDERLPRVADGLRGLTIDSTTKTPELWFDRVWTSRQAVAQLTDPPLELPRRVAIDRLRGVVVGPDGRAACIALELSDAATKKREVALEHIREVALREANIPADDLWMGGPPVDAVAIDRASLDAMYEFYAPSAVLGGLCLLWCIQSLRLSIYIGIATIYCECVAVALVSLTGGTMNGMLVCMPALILALCLSGSVHLTNYYRDSLAEVGPAEAPLRAIRIGWFPCVLAALTTAVGIGSLMLSEIAPVQAFGMYSTLGVAVAILLLFLLLPGAMVLDARAVARRDSGRRRLPPGEAWTFERPTRLISRHGGSVAAAGLLIMAMGVWGLTQVKTSMNLRTFFAPGSEILSDYEHLEERLGPLLPFEVVLAIDKDSPLTYHDKLVLAQQIESAIDRSENAGGTVSAATFAPPLDLSGSLRSVTARAVLNRKIARHRESFVESGFLAYEGPRELWRVSGRVRALATRPYRDLLAELESRTDEAVARFTADREADVETIFTGVLPLSARTQADLVHDLAESFGVALVVISVIIVFALRSLGMGLLALIPNVFPMVVIFGGMGWLGINVDIGSMMTASIGLGIAVDDTVHFLTWYRRSIRAGDSPTDAIRLSYRHCGAAMIRTTLICGAALIVFCASSFGPAARFSWLICVLLLAALVGDLLLLPALLVGPIGRIFTRRSAK